MRGKLSTSDPELCLIHHFTNGGRQIELQKSASRRGSYRIYRENGL
jgi:hypothetical protein